MIKVEYVAIERSLQFIGDSFSAYIKEKIFVEWQLYAIVIVGL